MDDLPPGYRFYPTEEELVSFYLHNMLNRTRSPHDLHRVIPLLDIYEYNPWDLPQYGGEGCGVESDQWFFFIPRQEREARGGRPNRLTTDGYWKATGSPNDVYNNSSQNPRVIGRKRTMVFYVGRAPNGTKTIWKMNEYKAVQMATDHASCSSSSTPQLREELSLCRIYKQSKCVRSFDRRPTPETRQNDFRAMSHHHDYRNEADTLTLNYQHNNPILLVSPNNQYRSLDMMTSSASGDTTIASNNNSSHDQTYVENSGNKNLDMAIDQDDDDIEALWGSDHFNWFDI